MLLDLAGDTPIVRPQELGVDLGCTLLAKHESQTQGGSNKDRIGMRIVEADR